MTSLRLDLRVWSAVFVLACSCGDPGAESSTGSESGSTAATATADTSGPGTTATSDPPTTGAGCLAPLSECDGACVDLEHDPAHCGDCQESCAPGLACIAGACGVACGPAASACGEICTDLQRDPAHCGECEHACPANAACVAGDCVPTCAADEGICGESCAPLARDEANCGGCGSTCVGDQPCVYGHCVDAAIHHLLISGQSLSTGSSSLVVSVEQPYGNLSFNTGVRAGGVGLTSFVPLIETQVGGEGETIASGLANHVAEQEQLAGRQHVILASAHGVGGQPYSVLKKGTVPYANGMAQVAAGAMIAAMNGQPYAVRALAIIHGESDHIAGNLGYRDDLLAWQSDYEADVKALTGQVHPLPMFLCQMSSYTKFGMPTSTIPQAQLEAARARPDRIFVVGPKYIFPYVDGVHLSGDGERWLGEYYAKVYKKVLIEGEAWRPLAPAQIVREGAVITLGFEVPAPPLVLDELLVANPGNFGFEYSDASGAPPAIVEVALVDATTVRVTLASEPVGGNRRIRYAYTGGAGQPAGPMTGARGNLRDSDATPSRHGYALYNWAVHFDEPVD